MIIHAVFMDLAYKKETAVLVPAYDESAVIKALLENIRHHGFLHIFVVDDGSADNTSQAATGLARVLRHRVNRGKGAATKTALMAAASGPYRYFVTMDGDGQHDPADIDRLLEPLVQGASQVSLGTRRLDQHRMPPLRRVINFSADRFVKLAFRINVTDSQCGFRAFTREALHFITTTADRYEFETEVLKEIHHHRLRYSLVPVRTIYSAYSTNKTSRQSILNGFVTLYKLLWKSLSF